MLQLNLSLPTRHDIRCPGCCIVLSEQSILFFRNLAVCPICFYSSRNLFVSSGPPLDVVVDTFISDVAHQDRADHRGLLFWTPRFSPPVPVCLLTRPEHALWLKSE